MQDPKVLPYPPRALIHAPKWTVIMLSLMLLLFCCRIEKDIKDASWKVPEQTDDGVRYAYQVPKQANDGWDIASLSQVGIAEGPIVNGIQRILDNAYGEVHSILIVNF